MHNAFHILEKRSPFGGAGAVFQGIGARLQLLKAMAAEQSGQFIDQAEAIWGKEVSCLNERSTKDLAPEHKSRAIAFDNGIALGETNGAAAPGHACELLQELRPVPGTQPASSQAQIHQIKVRTGVLQHAQG